CLGSAASAGGPACPGRVGRSRTPRRDAGPVAALGTRQSRASDGRSDGFGPLDGGGSARGPRVARGGATEENLTMAKPMHFGVTLPQIKRSWAEARDAAVEFDRLGFDSVWVCDHLYGVPCPHLPIFEAWSELAAVGPLTSRVELGTLVTPVFFRNPAVLAKQVATIDHVSNGRTVVGLGSGWLAVVCAVY